MTDSQLIQITNWYNQTVEKPNIIYNIFCDVFGEDMVDIVRIKPLEDVILHFSGSHTDDIKYQELLNYLGNSFHILVHFPHTIIENEKGGKVEANHLWARVPIILQSSVSEPTTPSQLECLFQSTFQLTRSEYPMSHLRADYMHSHCPGVPWSEDEVWMRCCLGTGPIKRTIASLCTAFDEDLWNLFCFELAAYVKTESLSGGPYRYLSKITNSKIQIRYDEILNKLMHCPHYEINDRIAKMMADFTEYFIDNYEIPITVQNNTYTLGASYFDLCMLFSKAFITWFNNSNNSWNTVFSTEHLINSRVSMQVKIEENKIYKVVREHNRSTRSDVDIINRMKGKRLFKFKGQTIVVNIIDEDGEDNHLCYIFSNYMLGYIITNILRFVNYLYGNDKTKARYTVEGVQRFL